ncbi:MAG: SPFH domain-containing protein [Bacteroidaceae bacterium]|nr:SPFH domain-containing protein [Bacteroidaceae bacterium]
METKEIKFQGTVLAGIPMLLLTLALLFLAGPGLIAWGVLCEGDAATGLLIGAGAVVIICSFFLMAGFVKVEPGEARVMMFFGKYRGTFTQAGYYWGNPFINTKQLSLRARNLDAEPIKVNDKTGNPVMIGMVIVWKLKDTYKAMFEIDSQTMAGKDATGTVTQASIMRAFEQFVRIQSDAALRQVAGQYAYDLDENDPSEPTLRDASDEISRKLEEKIDERLAMAGIEVIEARINYLAYAPEIAAVMLRRQQATAIIAAREKIVEGAVSMVKMALDKLSSEKIVEMDDQRKAQLVSNLLVVLCGDDNAQPVVNTGAGN